MGKKKVILKNDSSALDNQEKIESKVRNKQAVGKITRSQEGIIHVSCSYNNTLASLTDKNGNVIYWTSAGHLGFNGTRKGTPFAALKVGSTIADAALKKGIAKVHIKISGIGSGRDSAIRSISAKPVEIMSIENTTSVPHNGCRPKKSRRV